MSTLRSLLIAMLLASAVAAQGPLGVRKKPASGASSRPTAPYTGVMISMLPQSVEIETLDQRRHVCLLTAETQYSRSAGEFAPGDRIAINVFLDAERRCITAWMGTPEQRYQGDSGSRRPRIAPAAPGEAGVRIAPRSGPVDEFLEQARQANLHFTDRLPNFICRQVIRRSESRNLGKKWEDRDKVEAEVLIAEGQDSYRNISIDGQPTGINDMARIGGAWSTGEYSAIMGNLFEQNTHAVFMRGAEEKVREQPAVRYDFEVEQVYSRWTLHSDGQSYSPAYTGSVWLDSETGRAVRVRAEASYLPSSFPISRIESMLGYSRFDISGEEFSLPAEASVTGCMRGTATCTKNEIEFFDYQRFTADASVFHTESTIDFGTKEPPKEPQP